MQPTQSPISSCSSCCEYSYVISNTILEDAFNAATRDGRKVKFLVFTNPNNPTGTIASEEEMQIVLSFCRRHNIHLVIISYY